MDERSTGPGWPTQPGPTPPPGPQGWGQPAPPMGADVRAQAARPVNPEPPSRGPGMPPGYPPPAGGPPPARPAPALARPPGAPWPPAGGGRQRRADRGPGAGSLVVGGIFILTGAWFLIREFAPELEPSRFWPVAIVALGLVLLAASLAGRARRHGRDRA